MRWLYPQGINALDVSAGDTAAVFQKDTLASGGGLSKPELVEILVVSVCIMGTHVLYSDRLAGHSFPK